jgi:hypothetical protein
VSIPDLHFGRTLCGRDKVDSRFSSAPKVVLSRRRRRRTDTRKRNISLRPEVRPTYFRRARRVPNLSTFHAASTCNLQSKVNSDSTMTVVEEIEDSGRRKGKRENKTKSRSTYHAFDSAGLISVPRTLRRVPWGDTPAQRGRRYPSGLVRNLVVGHRSWPQRRTARSRRSLMRTRSWPDFTGIKHRYQRNDPGRGTRSVAIRGHDEISY